MGLTLKKSIRSLLCLFNLFLQDFSNSEADYFDLSAERLPPPSRCLIAQVAI